MAKKIGEKQLRSVDDLYKKFRLNFNNAIIDYGSKMAIGGGVGYGVNKLREGKDDKNKGLAKALGAVVGAGVGGLIARDTRGVAGGLMKILGKYHDPKKLEGGMLKNMDPVTRGKAIDDIHDVIFKDGIKQYYTRAVKYTGGGLLMNEAAVRFKENTIDGIK